jgi:hypothetical protein
MQLREKNNAAPFAFMVVAFVVVGGLITIYGVVAGFESYVLKFGLIAYLLIAGPLFLASLLALVTTSRHKSFWPTPQRSYQDGKRVKPRVRRVAMLFSFALLLLGLGSIVLCFVVVVFLKHEKANVPRFVSTGILLLFFYGIPIALQVAGRILLTKLFVRLGWLTPAEARDFAWIVHGYPPSCLEPFEEDE